VPSPYTDGGGFRANGAVRFRPRQDQCRSGLPPVTDCERPSWARHLAKAAPGRISLPAWNCGAKESSAAMTYKLLLMHGQGALTPTMQVTWVTFRRTCPPDMKNSMATCRTLHIAHILLTMAGLAANRLRRLTPSCSFCSRECFPALAGLIWEIRESYVAGCVHLIDG